MNEDSLLHTLNILHPIGKDAGAPYAAGWGDALRTMEDNVVRYEQRRMDAEAIVKQFSRFADSMAKYPENFTLDRDSEVKLIRRILAGEQVYG